MNSNGQQIFPHDQFTIIEEAEVKMWKWGKGKRTVDYGYGNSNIYHRDVRVSLYCVFLYKYHDCAIQISAHADGGDIGSLELFEDFLGLKLHLFEDLRPRKSSKRCNFRSLKLTFFEEFFISFFLWFNCFILRNDINSWFV